MTDLVAVDVDGTLKVGAPPGPIFTETLEGLAANGAIVVIVSPSPAAQGLWDRFDMVTADGLEREKALAKVKELYPDASRYVYVSDNAAFTDQLTGISYPSDAERAHRNGFEYIHPSELPLDSPRAQIEQILRPREKWFTDGEGRHSQSGTGRD